MSNYRAGDIIKLTRISLGITQEDLCDEICSVETLSRIENGRHGVKKSTYEQLMERMGRRPDKSYAVLTLRDFNVMDDMEKLSTAIVRYNFEEGEKYFEVISLELEDTVQNHQYEQRIEALLNFYQGRISKIEFLERLEKAINLTVPNYKNFLEKVYPFTNREIELVMNIASAYSQIEEYEMSIKIIDMLLRCLDFGYMNTKSVIPLKILLMHNKARCYSGLDKYEESIRIVEEGISLSKRFRWRSSLPNLMFELAWNIMQQIEKGARDKSELLFCKKILRQAYAFAAMIQKNKMKDIILKCYKENFQEDIYCPSSSKPGDIP